MSRLRDADVTVYRTDMQGTITCVSDGNAVSFTTEKNADAQTNPLAPISEEAYYIGNVNSLKFHRPDCAGLPSNKNRVRLDSRDAALNAGYIPCKTCKP
jgi:competence protein ComEC